MAVKTFDWDAADYLDDDETISAYLTAVFEDGDAKLVAAALGDVARAKGVAAVSSRAGLSHESLDRSLSEDGNPEFSTILRVLEALGFQLEVRPTVARAPAVV